MKFNIFFLFILFSFCATAEEYPGSWSTADLMGLCNGEKTEEKDQCIAFIAGVRAGAVGQRLFIASQMKQILETKDATKTSKTLFRLLSNEPYCPKENLNEKEMVNAVTTFISQIEATNPEFLEGGAGTSVLLAMYRTFRCSELFQAETEG